MRTSGNGKLKDVIYSIYGREAAAESDLELDYSMEWSGDERISWKTGDHRRKPEF